MPVPDSPGDFNWNELAPDEIDPLARFELAREVRIMITSGTDDRAIVQWLRGKGLSASQAESFFAEFADFKPSDWWERICSRASLILICLLTVRSIVEAFEGRSWENARYEHWRIHPLLGFTGFFLGAMALLYFGSSLVGRYLDHLSHKFRKKHH